MRRTRTTMTRRVDDEYVILDVTSGRYFSLEEVGALIWERLEAESTMDELVDDVVAAYDVDRERAAADVADLVADLVEAGLISGDA